MPGWLRAIAEGFVLPARLFTLFRAGPAWAHFRKVTLGRSLAVALIAAGSGYWVVGSPETVHHARPKPSKVQVGIELGGDDDDEDAPPSAAEELPLWRRLFKWVLWLYGIVWPAQWAVVALTRDYDDLFSSQLALGAGAAREVPPENPRTRLDVRWLWVQAQRRIWALLAWAPGVAVIALLAAAFPRGAQELLSPVLGAAWLGYWWVVGTTAKAGVVWEHEATAGAPFFLRGLTWLTGRIPVVRALVRLWARATKRLYAPAEALERAPLPLVGVAAFRLVLSVPLISLWTRPLYPAAVSLLVGSKLPQGKRIALR